MSLFAILAALGTSSPLVPPSSQTQDVKLHPVATGMTMRIGGYRPIPVQLSSTKPASVKRLPAGLKSPLYGTIKVGTKSFDLIFDSVSDSASKLYIDANGDGDLTNDAAPKWVLNPKQGVTMGQGHINLFMAGQNISAGIGVYKFSSTDPNRKQFAKTIFVYADYGLEGKIKLGKQDLPILLADMEMQGFQAKKGMLGIDRMGNGRIQGAAEEYDLSKPFNVNGDTVQLQSLDAATGIAKFARSSAVVAEIPLPPNLGIGQPAIAFTAQTMGGKTVKFPDDYKGKVVLLDFWATWCGPCRGEIPYSTKVYNKFKDQGYDVLGITLDQANQADVVTKFTAANGMPWPQVYEGKFWDVSLVHTYGVQGIPFVLLVDGDTGKIIQTEEKLRGDDLEKSVAAALSAKISAK